MIRGEPDNVERAKMAIKYAIRPRRPTHFLSLPIPSVSHSLEVLYSKMDTVDPSALVSPANFHITLGVLSLLDQVQVEQAVKYLKEHGPIIVDSVLEKPLNIKLQNLAIMQSDPGY
ncbi:hypothetical protein G6F56_009231 [Rhizopus delemar]|nr:hypothetical protein G6F56_009231 [Rhizopus delemar]